MYTTGFLTILTFIIFVAMVYNLSTKLEKLETIYVIVASLMLGWSAFNLGSIIVGNSPIKLSRFDNNAKFKIIGICDSKYYLLQKSEVDPLSLKVSAISNSAPRLREIEVTGLTNGQFVVAMEKDDQMTLVPFPVTNTDMVSAEKAK